MPDTSVQTPEVAERQLRTTFNPNWITEIAKACLRIKVGGRWERNEVFVGLREWLIKAAPFADMLEDMGISPACEADLELVPYSATERAIQLARKLEGPVTEDTAEDIFGILGKLAPRYALKIA